MKKKVLLFIVTTVALVGLATTGIILAVNANKVDTESEEPAVVASGEKVTFINKNAKLSDIKKVEGVVNIYMFWGDGCPHCKAQWKWLDSIREEYEGKIAVYGFEVFNNSANRDLMDIFANAVDGKEVNSVPYTIIGEKSVNSFSDGSTTGKKILEAVDKAGKSGADIYFDKIKK